ncbi:hypothetical protein ACJX0J_008826, partial [Zea mays]
MYKILMIDLHETLSSIEVEYKLGFGKCYNRDHIESPKIVLIFCDWDDTNFTHLILTTTSTGYTHMQ